MQILSFHEVFAELCKTSNKWGLLVAIPQIEEVVGIDYLEEWKKVQSCIPWLDFTKYCQAVSEGHVIVLCDTREEMEKLYSNTYGDDDGGRNGYYAYALTCDPEGNPITENT